MPRISRNENDDTNRVSSDILHTSQQMGCSNLWARLKIMCHVRQPIYHTRYSLPLRVATRFNGVAVKSKRNKSESPAVSRSFVSILFLVRFPPHSCPPLQRKIEAIIPARISSYPFENSFYEKPSLFALRCVFLLFIAGTCQEICRRRMYRRTIIFWVKFLSCLFRIKKKGREMPRT